MSSEKYDAITAAGIQVRRALKHVKLLLHALSFLFPSPDCT
jgi:hypothetical protein